jgi:hypothetical protein
MKIRFVIGFVAATALATLAIVSFPTTTTTAEETAAPTELVICATTGDSPAVANAADTDTTPTWLATAEAVGGIEVRFQGKQRIASQRFISRNAQGEAVAGTLQCHSECKDTDCVVVGCDPDAANKTCTPCNCAKATTPDPPTCTAGNCKYCRKVASIDINF